MKKIFTLLAVAAMALTASAQEVALFDYGTQYEDGMQISSGNATLTLGIDNKGWNNGHFGFEAVNKDMDLGLEDLGELTAFAQDVQYVNDDGEEKQAFHVVYTNGGNNPKDQEANKGSGMNYSEGKTRGYLPVSGTYYVFKPTLSGKVRMGIVINADKAFYLVDATNAYPYTVEDSGKEYLAIDLPDANLHNYVMKDAKGQVIELADDSDGKGGKVVETKTYATLEFDAEAGKTYYFFCTGSKLGCFGYVFTPEGDDPLDLTETVLWEGSVLVNGWADQPYVLSDGGTELINANAKVGDVLRFYMSAPDTKWQVELWEGHWGGTYLRWSEEPLYNEDGSPRESIIVDLTNKGYAEFTLTEEMLTNATTAQNWGGSFLLNGDGNITLSKVSILQEGSGPGPQPEVEKESIIDRFTYTWNESESLTHNEDGSITFNAVSWGGLAAWVATDAGPMDLSAYKALVFEFAEPTTVATQGFVQTTTEDLKWWNNVGITKLECSFEGKDVSQVNQIALQCAEPTTLVITAIYLVKDSGTNGIQETVALSNVLNENAPMYNLSGVRVNKGYKGIVIQNGKKFILK